MNRRDKHRGRGLRRSRRIRDAVDAFACAEGGIIPPQDWAFLEATGVAAIDGPDTNIPAAARDILKLIEARCVAAA